MEKKNRKCNKKSKQFMKWQHQSKHLGKLKKKIDWRTKLNREKEVKRVYGQIQNNCPEL